MYRILKVNDPYGVDDPNKSMYIKRELTSNLDSTAPNKTKVITACSQPSLKTLPQ